MPKLNISSVDLTEDEIDFLKAICNLSGESVRAQVRQIIKGHLVRFKPQYLKQINYLARKYGLTFQETFLRLTTGQPPFGEVVMEAPVLEEEEITNFGCEVKGAIPGSGNVKYKPGEEG
jgi:hypothetical protein